MDLEEEISKAIYSRKSPVLIMKHVEKIMNNQSSLKRLYQHQSLLCMAVENKHTDLLAALLRMEDNMDLSDRDQMPLVCATRCMNSVAVRLLLSFGARADVKAIQTFQSQKSRVVRDRTSAMEVALQLDHLEMMTLLAEGYHNMNEPLLLLACKMRAKACFYHLLHSPDVNIRELDSEGRDLLLCAAPTGAEVIQAVLDKGMKDRGQCTFHQLSTSLHLACKLESYLYRGGSQAKFASKDLDQSIQLLLIHGAKATALDSSSQLPIDCLVFQVQEEVQTREDIKRPYPVEEHAQMVLHSCRTLLKAMKSELGPSEPFPIRFITFLRLQQQLLSIMRKHLVMYRGYPSFVKASLLQAARLNLQITQMFLECGVDMQGKMKYHGTIVDYFFSVLMRQGFAKLCDDDLLNIVYDHLLLLLSYGGLPDENCLTHMQMLLSSNPGQYLRFVEVCLNRVGHESWTHMCGALKKELSALTSSNVLHGAVVDEVMAIVSGVRRLKQLCRVEIYKHVDHHQVARFGGQLPLPAIMKSYLVSLSG